MKNKKIRPKYKELYLKKKIESSCLRNQRDHALKSLKKYRLIAEDMAAEFFHIVEQVLKSGETKLTPGQYSCFEIYLRMNRRFYSSQNEDEDQCSAYPDLYYQGKLISKKQMSKSL